MKVGLFVPCYINAVYPQVGVASYRLLTRLGVEVDLMLTTALTVFSAAMVKSVSTAGWLATRVKRVGCA